MKPNLIPNDEDQVDKPSQSWGREGGGRDSKLGRLYSESKTHRKQTNSPRLRSWSLSLLPYRWRRATQPVPEDEPDLNIKAELEVKKTQSLRIVQIVSSWKPEPGSGHRNHRRWTISFDHILDPLFLLSIVERGTWSLLHTHIRTFSSTLI